MKPPADEICLMVYATLGWLKMIESLLCHPSAMRPDMPPEIRMAQDTLPTARIFVLSVSNFDFFC